MSLPPKLHSLDRDVFYLARPAPLHSSFLLFPSHFFLSHRAWKQKAARALVRPGGFSNLTF
jgi:hypothetical protein